MGEHAGVRIREAFKDLLSKRPYNEITVQAICSSADVTRKTFNKYYPTKEDIVIAQMRADFIDPTQTLRELLPTKEMEQATELLLERAFRALDNNRDYYRAVIKGLGDMWFVEHYDELAYGLSANHMYDNAGLDPVELDFVRHHFAALNAMSLRWWLNQDEPVSPETMTKYVAKWGYARWKDEKPSPKG